MDLSPRTHYALRALVCLTVKRGDGVVSGREIAAYGGIPAKFVEQIMHELRDAGFVRSQRGKGGGYSLSREPEDLTLCEVVEAIEGSLEGFGRMRSDDPIGPLLEPVWTSARAALREALDSETIAGVAERIVVNMYHI